MPPAPEPTTQPVAPVEVALAPTDDNGWTSITTPAAAELQRAKDEAHRLARENHDAAQKLNAALQERDALQRDLDRVLARFRDFSGHLETLGRSHGEVLDERDRAMARVGEVMRERDIEARERYAAVEARNAGVRRAVSLMRGTHAAVLERDEARGRLAAAEKLVEEKDEVIGALNREVQWLREKAGMSKPPP